MKPEIVKFTVFFQIYSILDQDKSSSCNVSYKDSELGSISIQTYVKNNNLQNRRRINQNYLEGILIKLIW